jgi:hypothetical protein
MTHASGKRNIYISTQTIQVLFVLYCQPGVTGAHEKGALLTS